MAFCELQGRLRCPLNGMTLSQMEAAGVRRVREAALVGGVTTISGVAVEQPPEALLVRQDGEIAYLIKAGIPDLVAENAILLESI